MERTNFYRKDLRYVLSFDANLAPQRDALASHTHEFAREGAPVYHALGEPRVLGGEPAVSGHIRVMQERAEYSSVGDFGRWSGRFVILTSDGATIESAFHGVFRGGFRWHWVEQAPPGEPVETKAFISLRFETANTKYKWIVSSQCVGYGLLWVQGAVPVRATFDIYAMA